MNQPPQSQPDLNDVSAQLSQVADQLQQVAQKLKPLPPEPTTAEPEMEDYDPLTEVPEALTQEAQNILQTAIQQLSGDRPEQLDPDQLYGWADSLQKVLGTTVSAPTSEVRKLEDLANQLSQIIDRTRF